MHKEVVMMMKMMKSSPIREPQQLGPRHDVDPSNGETSTLNFNVQSKRLSSHTGDMLHCWKLRDL